MNDLYKQVVELTYNESCDSHNKNLIKALENYHAMVSEGKLIPRGNRISTLQDNILMYNALNMNIH